MIKAEFIRKLLEVARLLCEEASDVSQGAPRHDMQEFLVQCGYDIRRAVADLVTDCSHADEKDTAALLRHIPLRRCMRCGERVRVEGETILCDGAVSKLAPLSVHVPITHTILGYPVRFSSIDQPTTSVEFEALTEESIAAHFRQKREKD